MQWETFEDDINDLFKEINGRINAVSLKSAMAAGTMLYPSSRALSYLHAPTIRQYPCADKASTIHLSILNKCRRGRSSSTASTISDS
jgi:hypothetical protein